MAVASQTDSAMPRYAILAHDWPSPHWDFFLETEAHLRSWRLLAEPGPGKEVPVEPNAVHRLIYLEYEGLVSGGRGTVSRWDAGTFDWIVNEQDRIVVDLHGNKLSGPCRIEGMRCQFQ
jgi:hypothetical protein